MDFKEGGTWHYCLRGPNPGDESWGLSTYETINRPEEIVYRDAFSDSAGSINTEMPQMIISLRFVEQGTQCKMISTTICPSEEELKKLTEMGVVEGMSETLDRLDEHLVTEQSQQAEIVIARTINVPAEKIFEAFTDPEALTNWWGPNGFSTTTHSMEFRPGGSWKFTMHGPDGTDFKNLVHYKEIERPKRIAYRHGGDEETEHIQFQVETTFEEANGKTTILHRMKFESEERKQDVIKNYGAVEGGRQTFHRLATMVES